MTEHDKNLLEDTILENVFYFEKKFSYFDNNRKTRIF